MSAEKVAEYEKKELAEERKTTREIADFILQLQGAFNLIGEDLGGLDALAIKAKENMGTANVCSQTNYRGWRLLNYYCPLNILS